jgi:magnesium transporter
VREVRKLTAADTHDVGGLRERGEPFWLDLVGPNGRQALESVGHELGLPEGAARAATEFGQRPRLAFLGDHALLVLFGAGDGPTGRPEMMEVHLLLGVDHLVTVHRAPLPALESLPVAEDARPIAEPVIGALIDSLLVAVEAIDDEIDGLEDEIIERLDESQMRRLTELRRALVEARHVGTPQRDLFLRQADELSALPGLSAAGVREVYSRLVAVRDLVDSTRELASGALDLYLSSTSNRLALLAERLTILTTLVLPLVVMTGFFGQNFGWLVERVDSLAAFLALGVGAPIAVIALLLYLLRRRGYL